MLVLVAPHYWHRVVVFKAQTIEPFLVTSKRDGWYNVGLLENGALKMAHCAEDSRVYICLGGFRRATHRHIFDLLSLVKIIIAIGFLQRRYVCESITSRADILSIIQWRQFKFKFFLFRILI